MFYQNAKKIDEALEKYSESKAKQILSLLKDDVAYRNYFFSKASSLNWFDELQKEGFFSPEGIPIDESGYVLFWDVLDYLERVSKQVSEHRKFAVNLIDIINNVIRFSDEQLKEKGKGINNYHIWWYCVKILNNIPNDLIAKHLPVDNQNKNIDKRLDFKTWLNQFVSSAQSSTLAISELTEKLIPKFLVDLETIPYAEAIIESVTRIQPKQGKDMFTHENEMDLVWDSHWVLKAFKKYGADVGAKCPNAAQIVAERLKESIQYKRNSHAIELQVDDELYQLKVSRVLLEEVNSIAGEKIRFSEDHFKGEILKYEPDQVKELDLNRDLWKLYKVEPRIKIKEFSIVASNQMELVNSFIQELPEEIDWKKAENFEKKMNYLYEGLVEDYSRVWCRSMAAGPEHASRVEDVLTFVLRDILIGMCESQKDVAKIQLDRFISRDFVFPIFKKLALYFVNKNWEMLNGIFFKFLETYSNPFHELNYQVELYDILQTHCLEFDNNVIQKLKVYIDDVPDYIEGGEEDIAYWKYEWISPLREHPDFKDQYEENKDKAKIKKDKPYEPRRKSHMAGFVKHSSPLSKEDILSKSNDELIVFLNAFEGADFWEGTFDGKPDKDGLKEALQQAAKDDPAKFLDDLSLFGQCHYEYLMRILWGIKDAWLAERVIAWDKLFSFCEEYLTNKPYLKQAKQTDQERGDRYVWIYDIISGLISAGSRNDERAFESKYFEQVFRIFDLMYDLVEGEQEPDMQRDPITYAINTPLGKVVEALIEFSLRVSRSEKEKQANWGEMKYERFFDKGAEAYIFLGRYLPQVRHLDEEFADKWIKELGHAKSGSFQWKVFMEGYLSGGHVYKELYQLMRVNYEYAIKNKFLEESSDQRLVQHIAIGYLRGYEELSDKNLDGRISLFWKLLNEANIEEKRDRWFEVIDLFWSVSGRSLRRKKKDEEASEEFKKKILDFWSWIYGSEKIIRSLLGDDYDKLLGRFIQFIVLFETIDVTAEEWLLKSVQHMKGEGLADTYFVEYLTKFENESSLKRIGKIFLRALEYITPRYKEEDIELIVKRIYEKGNAEDAEAICEVYGRRGLHFLRPIWEEFQKSNH